eukprot:TRINITY_DN6963_c0_g1_i5.p1 TRINITY_DN6963_c0_g1~~TRINITY_DN6963_c0_g1_i5.p1  ORF type:complete len:168 (-),score=22.02 TRINITY_DN6963_c0_g1_i5:51-521(-)
MVNLTNVNSARLSSNLFRRADDLITGRKNGRLSIKDKDVRYVEMAPLALKNRVADRSQKDREKSCFQQMMDVMACLGKFDQNQSMCTKEIDALNVCYKNFNARRKEEAMKGAETPLGPRARLTGTQMTAYMNKFSQSKRKNVFHDNSVYKDFPKFK